MMQYFETVKMTRWASLALIGILSFSCRAQIKNGEIIRRDAFLLTRRDAAAAEHFPLREKFSEEAGAMNDRGVEAARALRLDEAEQNLSRATQIAPLFGLAYFNLARLYLLAGEEENANRVYGAMARVKEFPDAQLYDTADALVKMIRTEEGIGLMRALVEAGRSGTKPALYLGNYSLGILDYRGADSYFDLVLKAEPKNSIALFGRGYVRFLAEDYPRAAEFFSLAQVSGSHEPQLCVLYLRSLFKLSQIEKASAQGDLCKGVDPQLIEIKARISLALNPFADLTGLLSTLPSDDARELYLKLFGAVDLRARSEIRKDLELTH